MPTAIPKFAPIRYENVVKNYKEMAKTKPYLTLEYGLEALLNIFTLHDFSMFHVLEEEYGTDKAVELYARVWKKTDVSGMARIAGSRGNESRRADHHGKNGQVNGSLF